MKKKNLFFIVLIFFSTFVYPQEVKNYSAKSPELKSVKLTNGFWFDRFETNRKSTIPHVLKECYETGRVDNLAFAAKLKQGEFCSAFQFDDSDVYKTIEAISYSFVNNRDPQIERQVDSIISIIQLAQEPDGYLYSPRSAPSQKIKGAIGPERWVNLQWSHELYVLGHLYEAAAAHYQATGKTTLLNIALKSAELVLKTFNPQGLQLPPGHEEVELGLIRLYEVTGEKKYLDQAKYFIDIRGRGKELTGRKSWGEYAQDHKPVLEQEEATGHAVRAAYLYSAMTDIAGLTNNTDYKNALERLWKNVVDKQLYITGGIGSTGSGEAFGGNYDLPNASAYNETCSSIANMMWDYCMFLLFGDGKYLDVFERTLYNAFLSGVGLDGKSFFYPNPLQSYGTHGRTPWFTCACCPPNVARFIASLPEKLYATSNDEIFVNIFSSNTAALKVGGQNVEIKQETNYPWSGDIKLFIQPETAGKTFSVKIRIPGWATGKPIASDLYSFKTKEETTVIKVNGKVVPVNIEKGFAEIKREWNAGDVVEVSFPMQVNSVVANEKVEADKDRIALQRGPVMYCAEWPDNKDGVIRNLLLNDNENILTEYDEKLLNGVEVITGKGRGYFYDNENILKSAEQEIKFIPYYAWAHRGTGEMSVWLADKESAVSPLHGPTLISSSKISVLSGEDFKGINDQIEPKNSADEDVPFYHWWPNKGTKEWVQIDFPKTNEVSQLEIYWFDDTGVGECRVPESWKVFYKDGDKWNLVYTTDKYGVEKDKFNGIIFETVKTGSLKIEIQSQKDFAGGIHEIKIK
jgi:uncharacterized protein